MGLGLEILKPFLKEEQLRLQQGDIEIHIKALANKQGVLNHTLSNLLFE